MTERKARGTATTEANASANARPHLRIEMWGTRRPISLSLSDLSPLNPPPEDHLLVVLKSYFDTGNHADSSEYDRISVGVVCGSGKQWKEFDRAWKKVLYKHRAAYLHTTDAVTLQNDFAVEKGWSHRRVDLFIGDCVDVISKHIVIPSGVPGKRVRMGLYPITLTIMFDDWIRAIRKVPELPNTIEEMLAADSVGYAFKWGRFIGAQKFQLFFDRGEKLYGHIKTRWDHPKAKQDIEIMQDVVNVGEAVSSLVPALQMADLFAWGINHANQEKREWHIRLHDLPWQSRILEYEHLINPIKEVLEHRSSWKLPPRKSSVSNLSKPKKTRPNAIT